MVIKRDIGVGLLFYGWMKDYGSMIAIFIEIGKVVWSL
jgi:hypothetical protein